MLHNARLFLPWKWRNTVETCRNHVPKAAWWFQHLSVRWCQTGLDSFCSQIFAIKTPKWNPRWRVAPKSCFPQSSARLLCDEGRNTQTWTRDRKNDDAQVAQASVSFMAPLLGNGSCTSTKRSTVFFGVGATSMKLTMPPRAPSAQSFTLLSSLRGHGLVRFNMNHQESSGMFGNGANINAKSQVFETSIQIHLQLIIPNSSNDFKSTIVYNCDLLI